MDRTLSTRAAVACAAFVMCAFASPPARASLPGNGYGRWSWTTGSPSNQLDLRANAGDATCFLSGVGGDLAHGGGSAWAGAYVYQAGPNAEWTLQVSPGTATGALVEAHATCIWATQNAYSSDPLEGNGTIPIGAVGSGRQCFLQGVIAYDTSFANTNAKVEVYNDGSEWYLAASGMDSPNVVSIAACVDVPTAGWFEENNWTGTFQVPMEETSTNPVACGLLGLEGAFTGAASDGVNLSWPASDPGYWTLATSSGKRGWLTCLD